MAATQLEKLIRELDPYKADVTIVPDTEPVEGDSTVDWVPDGEHPDVAWVPAAIPATETTPKKTVRLPQDDMDMDMPGFLSSETEEQPVPRKRKALGEAARSTFKPERVRIPSTGSATVAPQLEPQSPDVADAMSQVEAFKGLGWGGRFC